jgi:hypothetical protein
MRALLPAARGTDMARVVLKYHLRAQLPESHKFLHADVQNGDYFVWLEVEPNQRDKFVDSPYHMIPTGYREVPMGAVHKATIIDHAKGLVWHIYDVRAWERT